MDNWGIKSVEEIFEQNEPQIPNYQRPYVWSIKNVRRLIGDIKHYFRDDKEYLIGNIILHKNEGKFDIIDGQQRLVTLALMLKVCGIELKFLEQEINPSSKQALVQNFNFIKTEIKSEIAEFIKKKIKLTYYIVQDIDEAFVVFDTQNTLGKPPKKAELLKNHHFIHIKELGQDRQNQIAKRWKKYQNTSSWNNFSLLEATLNDLYIARKIFKGENFSLGNYINYNDLAFDEFLGIKNKGYMRIGELKFSSSIIEGFEFFSYTLKYCNLYKRLFDEANFCQKYYINQAMMVMLLIYVDKFGFDDNFNQFFECVFVYLFAVLSYYDRIFFNCIWLVNDGENTILTRIFKLLNTSDFSHELINKLKNDIEFEFKFGNENGSFIRHPSKAFELLHENFKSKFSNEIINKISFEKIKF